MTPCAPPRPAESGVVVLSDTGDTVFGGAAGDSTVLIDSMLRLGIGGRALVPIVDPGAVATLRPPAPGAHGDAAARRLQRPASSRRSR